MEEHGCRRDALQEAMRRRGIGAAVVGATDHMRYLAGWAEPPGERFLCLWVPSNGAPTLVVPSLYADDVRNAVTDIPVVEWHDSDGWVRAMSPLLADSTYGHTTVVDDDLGARHLLDLQGLAPHRRWLHLSEVMSDLRGTKSAAEIQRLERSAAMADRVYREILPAVVPGVSERALQTRILSLFSDCGASSAWAIVCVGSNSALPHHHSGDAILRRGDIVILDLGGCLDGYQSDITRTFSYGPADSEATRIYDVVHEAHMAALAAAIPGVTCEDVDRAARAVIVQAGYGERFVHRTGHGIGLSTHEPPNLVQGDRTVLRPGMCFSDEPGVYLPGRFGVRIENII
ncbi:MAG: aminopeptidase P family protein, partial [Armatimonadetes bacterium]|nr:aminopeptidase P family protein [Armatimonadota bacterium]